VSGRVAAVVVAFGLLSAPAAWAATPKITSFTPASGSAGTSVTITGSDLSTTSAVTFNGTAASFTVASATKVTATVPAGASTGPIAATTADGTATSSKTFTVNATAAPPSVSLNPSAGPPGTSVTVSGSGFGANEAVDVYEGATDVVVISTSSTGAFSATITVPSSAATGTLWITAVGRHSGSSASAAFAVSANWSQYRYSPTHRGRDAGENIPSPSNVDNIDVDWQFTTGGQVESSPSIVNGIAYFGSYDGDVYAVNATTGALVWSYATGGGVFSSPAVVNGIVYIGSTDDKVYALNAATGVKLWSTTTGAAVYSSPAVVGGVVYIGSYDDKLYALNAATGAVNLTYTNGGGIFSSPAVSGGRVYFDSFDGYI
jgi:outer membrane protein assembly factor BamB